MTSAEAAERYKDGVRALWSRGDYDLLAQRVYPIAKHLCTATAVGQGTEVLDVATGTGNVAVEAARRGGQVSAIDLTPRMVDITRTRAQEEGLAVRVHLGDAEDLPFAPGSFDAVLSACGLWWAPRPDVALAEARRVLRRDGVVGLAGFTPGSYFGQVEELIKARVPLPPGVPERNDWAAPELAISRLESEFGEVAYETGTIPWTFDTASDAARFLFDHSASHMAALDALDAASGAQLVSEVEQLTSRCSGAAIQVDIDLDYLVLVGRLPL